MPFVATWMQLEIIMLSKISQKDNANIIWDHLYVESKIWHKSHYLWNRNRLIDIENRLVVDKMGGRLGEGLTGNLGLIGANWASQVVPVVKNPPANPGDLKDAGLILRSGKSPAGGHGNPLQYSCLENPADRGSWCATVTGLQRVGHDWSYLAHMHSCKLLHMERMHNKILPFSTGNNIQYPVINHTGNEYKKMFIYV